MAKTKVSIRRVHPASIANLFVRGILADIGQELSGFSNEQWQKTLEYFGSKCVYTGERILDGELDRDHAVPVNTTHGGLHMYGNLVPATRKANNEKGGLTFEQYLNSDKPLIKKLTPAKKKAYIKKIREFQEETGYTNHRARLVELTTYCQKQYDTVKQLYEDVNQQTLNWLRDQGIELTARSAAVEVDMDIFGQATEEDLTLYLPKVYASLINQFGAAKNGVFIKKLFKQLNNDGYLSKYLIKLIDKQYSAKIKSAVPVLAKERVKMPKIFRHYPEPIPIDGKSYYLSSQWNKPQRGYLFTWLTDEVFADYINQIPE